MREIPLFRSLPKVELAKLIPDVEVITLTKGSQIAFNETDQAVYFVHSGWVELLEHGTTDPVPLLPLGPGDAFGDLGHYGKDVQTPERVRARTDAHILRIGKERFDLLCRSNPTLAQGVSQLLAHRVSQVHAELARTRRMLAVYAKELWNNTPDELWPEESGTISNQEAAAAVLQEEEQAQDPPSPSASGSWIWLRRNWCNAGLPIMRWTLVLGIIPVLVQLSALRTDPAISMLVLMAWGALNWIFATIPDYAVGLALVTATAGITLVTPAIAFSGFASPIWFLSLGVYGIGAAIQRSGLLYRFALFMLRCFPPVYWGQSLAIALTGLILTPALPSANGRVMIASPLARELAQTMHMPDKSKGSLGLALACHHGFGQMFFLFLNGTGSCLMVWGLLPAGIREQVTWWSWFITALPLGVIIFAGFYLLLLRLGTDVNHRPVNRQVLDLQTRALGPFSRHESMTLAVTLGVLLGFITQPLHGLNPAWPAVGGLVLLLGLSVVDKPTFRANIDWTYLIFFGTLISLAEIISETGLDLHLKWAVTWVLDPLSAHPWLFLGGIALLTYLVRIAIPWPSTVLLMMLATMPVASSSGYSPFLTGLVMLTASNPWFLPHQNTVYLNVHSGTNEQSFAHRQAMPYGALYAALTLLAILASIPYWRWLGLVP